MKLEEIHDKVQQIYKDPTRLLTRVWELSLPGSPKPTELQKDMLRFVCIDAPRRAILQAFRGCGKSWISCVAIVWHLIHNPYMQCMLVSASKNKATENAKFIMDIFKTLPELNHMLPRPDQRSSITNGFDISLAKPAQSCSVYSVGFEGQIEGKRADIILADDIEVASNSSTADQRQKVLYRANEFESILKPPTKGNETKVIALGTPQSFESVYTELGKTGYFTRIYPALRPSDEEVETVYMNRIAPYALQFKEGESIEPTRFTPDELQRRAKSRSYFQLHFMLNCTLSDANRYPLKINDLIVDDVDNDVAFEKVVWCSDKDKVFDTRFYGFNKDRLFTPMARLGKQSEYQECVMAVDPSGHGEDETGYAIVKLLNGYLYVIDAGGLKGGYQDENLSKLANLAKRYKVNRIVLESNFGDGMFAQLLRPWLSRIYACGIDSVRSSKQKELRIIECLEPLLNQHRIVFNRRLIETDTRVNETQPDFSLLYQLSHITRDRNSLMHDDVLDALSMACTYCQRSLDVDAQQLMKSREWDEYFEQEARIFGLQHELPTWGAWLKN